MRREHFADFSDHLRQCVIEFFVLKMRPHPVHNVLPELFAAFFVDRLIANNSELARSWRYENQHRIALAGLIHSEPLKFFLSNDPRIATQFVALNINANFAGGFRFSFANCVNDPIILELVEKFLCSHFHSPTRSCAAATKTSAAAPECAAGRRSVAVAAGRAAQNEVEPEQNNIEPIDAPAAALVRVAVASPHRSVKSTGQAEQTQKRKEEEWYEQAMAAVLFARRFAWAGVLPADRLTDRIDFGRDRAFVIAIAKMRLEGPDVGPRAF